MTSGHCFRVLLNQERAIKKNTYIGNESNHYAMRTMGSKHSPKLQKLMEPAAVDAEEHRGKSVTPADDSNGSSDDEIGPQLPPRDDSQSAGTGDQIHSVQSTGRQNSPPEDEQSGSDGRQRDEWMVLPPDSRSWMSHIDPTALRSRKFNTARSSQIDGGRSGPSAAWTESPGQKRMRLENEIMGIQDPLGVDQQKHASGPSKVDDATAGRVKEFNERKKEASLYESRKRRLQESSDDPSSRAFDREKDIASPTSITSTDRREMLKRAAGYSSRFSGGKYL